MKPRLDYISEHLAQIKKDSLYRQLRSSTVKGPYITINKKKMLNLCSNDYLGITSSKLENTAIQSSSRLVSGNDESYKKLECVLAQHRSQQSALVFPTGYMANLGAITAVAKKGDVILSDELNHASIIEATKLAGCKVIIYKHNDVDDLQKKMQKIKTRTFVITEGIFSMDGDFAKLDEIVKIAEKYNAITILDDAHGDFVVGSQGKGTAEHYRVAKKIDIHTSSLSKALGSFGGYVASQNNVTDLCINRSKSFIYTSALPSVFVNHALKRINQNQSRQRAKLEKNISYITKGLTNIGYDITSHTQIIPIIIGAEKTAMDFGRYLMLHGVFAQPIRYPTVAKNKARIRLSITARLDECHLQKALDVFEKAAKRFNII